MRRNDDAESMHMPSDDTEDNYGTLMPPVPARQGMPATPALLPSPVVEFQEPAPAAPPANVRTPAADRCPLAAGSPEAVCRRVRLSDKAARLLDRQQTLLAYLYRLIKRALYRDAIKVLGHALPQRSAIWWAWQCARRASGPLTCPEQDAALDATEAWLAESNEDWRRLCGSAAADAGPGTPAGSAALAVFWTASNPVSPWKSSVQALENDPAEAVACAVILTAMEGGPEGAAGRYSLFLRDGIGLAIGISCAP
jgi:hypothetical protein